MSLSEYAVLFVMVMILGAGIPGPGDASLIAAGTLAGEGKLNIYAATRQKAAMPEPAGSGRD